MDLCFGTQRPSALSTNFCIRPKRNRCLSHLIVCCNAVLPKYLPSVHGKDTSGYPPEDVVTVANFRQFSPSRTTCPRKRRSQQDKFCKELRIVLQHGDIASQQLKVSSQLSFSRFEDDVFMKSSFKLEKANWLKIPSSWRAAPLWFFSSICQLFVKCAVFFASLGLCTWRAMSDEVRFSDHIFRRIPTCGLVVERWMKTLGSTGVNPINKWNKSERVLFRFGRMPKCRDKADGLCVPTHKSMNYDQGTEGH